MLGAGLQFNRSRNGEDQFYSAARARRSQDHLRRSQNRSQADVTPEKTKGVAASPMFEPASSCNLERFLESITPSVPAQRLSKTTLKEWRTSNENCQPYFVLADLWESFKEWSVYGAGVPLIMNDSDLVVQYYVPYLSGVQLYVDPSRSMENSRRLGEESDGDYFRDSSSEGSSDCEQDRGSFNHSIEQRSYHHQTSNNACRVDPLSMRDQAYQESFSSDESDSGSSQSRLLFEYLEQDQPCREPLADKICDLALRFPELKMLRSCDLLPSSWISVAWYPIYRIPMGPTLEDLDACFLTFHSLHTPLPGSETIHTPLVSYSNEREDGVPKISLPVFGLATYKYKVSLWTPNAGYQRELVTSLLQAADNWLKLLQDPPSFGIRAYYGTGYFRTFAERQQYISRKMQRPRGPRPGLPIVGSSSSQTNILQTHDKLRFGNIELLCFPNSNISFKTLSHISVTKAEKCILHNLWISYNKNPKDQKYFLACLNALSEHFSQDHKQFKCYVVLNGRLPGIYHTWLEVSDCIKNFPNPLYKGFYSISEALEECRKFIGPNYFIAPSLKNVSDQPLDYSSRFCDHCECMTKNFKILNESNQILQQEKLALQKKISDLEQEIINLKILNPISQTEAGTIEPNKSIVSPAQTEAGKDLSNPFMVLGLSKAQQTQRTVDSSTSQTQQAENPVIYNKEDQTQQTDNSATRLISPIDLKQKSPINFPGSFQSAQDPDQISQSDIRKIKEMFEKIEEIQQQVKQSTTKKKKLQIKKKNKGKKKIEQDRDLDDSKDNNSEDNPEDFTDGGDSLDSIGRHNYATR